jgi:spherulation-specific family 4 protein
MARPQATYTVHFLGLLVGPLLLGLHGCSDPGPELTETVAAALTTQSIPSALMVPVYIYTGDTTYWPNAIPTNTNNSTSYFIVSGPPGPQGFAQPPAALDPNLVTHVNQLHAAKARVLGYVTWKQALNRASADVRSDIDRWAGTNPNYPNLGIALDGIFIDDAERSDQSILAQTEWLVPYVQNEFPPGKSCMGPCPGLIEFNWGGSTPTMEQYADCALEQTDFYGKNATKFVTFENDQTTYLCGTNWNDANHSWVHNLNPYRFANLVYGVPASGSTLQGSITCANGSRSASLIQQSLTANSAFLYFTDDGLSNPWDTIASNPLWRNTQTNVDEQSLISGIGRTGYSGRDQASEIYTYSGSACPPPVAM